MKENRLKMSPKLTIFFDGLLSLITWLKARNIAESPKGIDHVNAKKKWPSARTKLYVVNAKAKPINIEIRRLIPSTLARMKAATAIGAALIIENM